MERMTIRKVTGQDQDSMGKMRTHVRECCSRFRLLCHRADRESLPAVDGLAHRGETVVETSGGASSSLRLVFVTGLMKVWSHFE